MNNQTQPQKGYMPSNVRAEKQLLGALISITNNPEIVIGELILSIRPEWFSQPTHKSIMTVLRIMIERGDVIIPDMIAQFSQIKKAYNVSDDEIVADLNNICEMWKRFLKRENQSEKRILEALIDVVRDRFMSIELANFGKNYQMVLRSDQTYKAKLAEINRQINALSESFSIPTTKQSGMNLMDAVARSIEVREAQLSGNNVLLGMSSGFKELDVSMGGHGIERGKVYGIGGLSGMGKTSFAVNVLTHLAKNGFKSLFFSYEMSEQDIQYKILGAETGISSQKIKKGQLDKHEWAAITNTANTLRQLPITYLGYEELRTADVGTLEQRLRKEVEKGNVDVVLVDHIALVQAEQLKNPTETDRVTFVARRLSRLAKELNVAMLIICQLNREVERRASKRPTSSDVKNSGAIWEECDMFLFVHRESRFETEGHHDVAKQRYGTIIVGKNRFGRENVDISVIAELEFSRFRNLSDDHLLLGE